MLKKAGIVVAAAAAGLLAVSPLAFAGEQGHKGDKGDYGRHHKADTSHSVTYDHSPSCNAAPQTVGNNQPQSAGVASPLVALAGVAANIAAPITPQLQTPILSCNNLQDIANVDIHDNFQDNSRSVTNRSFNGND